MNAPARSIVIPTMPEPLSPLHRMLAKIGREHHALRLNRVANHPSVYRWVKGYQVGKLDLSGPVADIRNVLLMAEHGGVFFYQLQPGLYDVHAQVLPGGRGKWAMMLAHATAHWMFTRTDAMELVSRCPQSNVAARALTVRAGAKRWFTNPTGWVMDNDPVPADVFSLTINDWITTAPGLVERGQWFYRRLTQEYARHGKSFYLPPDISADYERNIGAAIEMFLGEQVAKGMVLYARFAVMAGLVPIRLVQQSPLALALGDAIIVIRDGDFYVASV